MRLVDAREFQRLRRVRQLGLAAFAYQGAEHSRFSHSLGVLHLVTRILDKLADKNEISDFDRVAVRAAALLHDVGHGAFSHVMENVLDFHHEDFTVAAVLSDETEIGRVLLEFSADLPTAVAAIIRGEFEPQALAQLVSSQLDVDRMDYLLRDSLMTGVKYGIFDLEWILKTIEIDAVNDRIYVSANGLFAVEDYLQARYYMFRQVYFHRTLRSAEVVLRAVLRRALELFRANQKVWFAPDTAFEKVMRGETLTLGEHLELDDSDVVFHIKQWQRSDDAVLADLSARFTNRRLFKALDLDMPLDERREFLRRGGEVVEKAGFDPNFYFVEDVCGDVPYRSPETSNCKSNNLIFVENGFSHPVIRELSTVSQSARRLQQPYEVRRICFPHELTTEILQIYQSDGEQGKIDL